MAGYIGSKASVTQVDGYNQAEADAEFVDKAGDTMTGGLTVGGSFTSLGIDDNATSTAVTIDSSGRVTMPYQPRFSVAKTDGAQANASPITFNVLDVNVGSHWNGSRFTAPVAGHYFFSASLLTSSGVILNYQLRVNGSMYRTSEHTSSSINYKSVSLSCIVPMAAGDYVELNSNSSSVYGGGGNYSMLSGYLVG